MKKLLKNTDPNTPEVLFVFEDEQTGQMISNPLWNPEMTSYASPERYGFKVWDTGGGCTAHGQEFLLDGQGCDHALHRWKPLPHRRHLRNGNGWALQRML
jgi:hypothetical protein